MIENTEKRVKQLNLDKEFLEIKKLKKCSKCKKVYPASKEYFHRRKKGKYGLDSWCKNCHKISHKEIHIRKTYGITLDKLREMLIKQNYRCTICGRYFDEIKKLSHKHINIDHDHKTGKIRGVLCASCNRMIGFGFDNPFIFVSAIKYVKKHKERKNKLKNNLIFFNH